MAAVGSLPHREFSPLMQRKAGSGGSALGETVLSAPPDCLRERGVDGPLGTMLQLQSPHRHRPNDNPHPPRLAQHRLVRIL
jgi:hypothetical protein